MKLWLPLAFGLLVVLIGGSNALAEDAQTYFDQGNELLEKGEADQAIEAFTKALELKPDFVEALTNRGAARVLKRDYAEAVKDFTRATEVDPKYARAWYRLGAAMNASGNYDQAIASLDKALEINSDYCDAYTSRAEAYSNKRDFDKAFADCDKAEESGAKLKIPKYSQPRVTRAIVWSRKAKTLTGSAKENAVKKVVAEIEEALKIDSESAGAYGVRGLLALEELNDYDLAISDCTHALKIDKKLYDCWDNRGCAWTKKGDYEKAIDDCTESIRVNPRYHWSYADRAEAYLRKGDYDKAIADCDNAIAIAKFSFPYFIRAAGYLHKGDYDKAIADCNEGFDLHGLSADAFITRGDAWGKKGNYDNAAGDYQKALILDAKCADAYSHLAWLQAACPDDSRRDAKKAIANATKACDLTKGKQWESLDICAAAFAESGDFDQAQDWESRAIKAAGDAKSKDACRGRQELYQQGKPYRWQ